MTQVPLPSTSQESLSNSDMATGSHATVMPDNADKSHQLRANVGNGRLGARAIPLARQLLTTVLPLSLAPLLIASVTGYVITQGRVQSQIRLQIEGQSLLISNDASLELGKDVRALQGLALSPFITNTNKAAAEFADTENLMEQSTDALENRFSATRQVNSNNALNNFLSQYAETEEFAELLLTDRNGLTVGYSSLPTTFVQTRDNWWQQGKAQSQWVSDPARDESADAFGVSLSVRIEDTNSGEFLGVLRAFSDSESLAFLGDYLRNSGITGSQQVQLLDVSSGFAIAGFSAEEAILPRDNVSALQITGGRTVSEIAAKLTEAIRGGQVISVEELSTSLSESYPISNLQVRQVSEGEENQNFVLSFNFEEKLYALSVVSGVDWVAIASMDLAEVRAQGQELLTLFGLIAVVLGGISAVITIGVSNRLSSPLNDLSDKARQVSAGNLDVTADPKGTSETQSLAQTFNQLVLRVKGSLTEQALNARKANLFADITGTTITSSSELGGLFNEVMTEARDILQADRVVFYQFGQDWNGWIAAESVANHLPNAMDQGLSDPCIPEETRARYFTGEVLQIDDVRSIELHPAHLQLLTDLDVRSMMAVGIKSQGRLFGLVITHHCKARHNWQASETGFLQQLGLQLGLVLERIQLLEQTEALAEEQRQIKEGLQRSALQLLMEVDPVSHGDLTVRAKVTEDEIGTLADSYNATISSLRKIVKQVKAVAEQVGSTTTASDQSIRQLSTSALQQANEITAALDQAQAMATSVRQVANNANEAELAVQQAAQTVQEGDEAMNRTVDGILAIRETVAETAKKVKRLGESSQKISNVVNLISGFAAQTNMLALNASIEASRAGEGGKGFAVVAEEVRELARQSAEATTEIEKLVAGIQTETNEVVLAMEEGTQQVVDGTKLVDDTRQSLNRITAASEQISGLVEAITQATTLQSQASETVTASMTNVATIANQNSEEANRVSNSFEELNTVAQVLQEEVGRFTID